MKNIITLLAILITLSSSLSVASTRKVQRLSCRVGLAEFSQFVITEEARPGSVKDILTFDSNSTRVTIDKKKIKSANGQLILKANGKSFNLLKIQDGFEGPTYSLKITDAQGEFFRSLSCRGFY